MIRVSGGVIDGVREAILTGDGDDLIEAVVDSRSATDVDSISLNGRLRGGAGSDTVILRASRAAVLTEETLLSLTGDVDGGFGF